MPIAHITRRDFLRDRQGREFSDVLENGDLPFDAILALFNRSDQQHRMEESETVHRRAPITAIVQDIESLPAVQRFLAASDPQRKHRFEQSITILVRMTMERLGWQVIPQVPVKH